MIVSNVLASYVEGSAYTAALIDEYEKVFFDWVNDNIVVDPYIAMDHRRRGPMQDQLTLPILWASPVVVPVSTPHMRALCTAGSGAAVVAFAGPRVAERCANADADVFCLYLARLILDCWFAAFWLAVVYHLELCRRWLILDVGVICQDIQQELDSL